jgi:23S rRNA (cytosine1962-C5)-methyltransferase
VIARPVLRTARVVLSKNLARSIRRGHPWIYRDALRPPPPLADGAPVMVTAPDGRPLARGFWDVRSAIAVRIVSTDAEGDLAELVGERARAALDRRLAAIAWERTDAFRCIHGEADGLPGVHADLYRHALVVRFDGGGARAFYGGACDLPARLIAAARRRSIEIDLVIERKRSGGRAAGAAHQGEDAGETGAGDDRPGGGERVEALVGALPAGEIEVRENGLLFGVDLARGQKGGLFLDQRDNRERVRALAGDRRVLNLFGYTGGFSIYAAAAGATRTTTVDVAREALAAARRNFERNRLPLDAAEFHGEDVFAFLQRAARDGAAWDLVISDPPSFAPSRKALPAALGAYRRLHRLCAAVVAPGGMLCAASCSSHVGRHEFLRTVAAGAADAGRTWRLDELHGAGADHPVVPQFPEGDYLKFAVGRV